MGTYRSRDPRARAAAKNVSIAGSNGRFNASPARKLVPVSRRLVGNRWVAADAGTTLAAALLRALRRRAGVS